MAERRMGMIAFLCCLCLCLMCCCAQAASTADAKEAISPEKECTLILSYRYNGAGVAAVPVDLYRVADVSSDFQYTLASPFSSSALELNGIQTAEEWNAIRTTLEAYIISHNVETVFEAVTDPEGQICFEGLKTGLYLAVNGKTENCSFDAALISLPGLGADGMWQYRVTVFPKGKELPPVNPDEETEFKILKLWKGDEDRNVRPQSIQAEIFRDGESHQIVSLSNENNWSYTWTAQKDGANWNVVELNVPSGYVMTVEKRDATFILTNTLPANNPPSGGGGVPKASSPQTGDNPHILLYTVLMYVSGIVLVILGITGKRKRS